jgi:hypothetical protein
MDIEIATTNLDKGVRLTTNLEPLAPVVRCNVNLKDIIRTQKSNLDTGKWAVGHVPRSAFPMSRLKDKRYRYGSDYSWRLVKFEVGMIACRILILLNESKEILRARLGVEMNGDMVVLSDYEFHATEPGWHCHVTFQSMHAVGPGAARHEKTKWPRQSSRLEFGVDEKSALSRVAAHFKFGAQGELI